MKKAFLIFSFIFSSFLYAFDVEVNVEPKQPIVGESFHLTFTIPVTGNDEPYISFDPGGAEVVSKDSRGVSINTTIINGRVTTKKEISYDYEMSADKAGSIRISNVKVDMGGKVQRLSDIHLNILSEPVKSKSIFAMAVVSKKDVFVGEGIDVDYYLYAKDVVTAYEIETFPKLNKFTKRIYTLNDNIETVRVGNEIYRRSAKFAARIFPEKPGKLVVDPIKFKVQYKEMSANIPGGFGLMMGTYRTKSVASEKVEIDVLPLPSENVPANFTGLVGEHNFKLDSSKTKFLANEAIELRFEVSGPGALESYDGPEIYQHNNLEKFDTKSEMSEIDRQSQLKKFDYTYLGRGPLKIDKRQVALSYFDPTSKSYKSKTIDIPGLEVSGGSAGIANDQKKNEIPKTEETEVKKAIVEKELRIFPLVFETPFEFKKYLKPFNIFLVFGCFVVWGFVFMRRKTQVESTKKSEAKKAIKKLKVGPMSYSDIFKLIMLTRSHTSIESNPLKVLEAHKLSEETYKYFYRVLGVLEEVEFKGKKIDSTIEFNAKCFKEIENLVE